MFAHFVHLALCLLPGIYASTNYSIDDQDPSIIYTPKTSWTMTIPGNLDAGGAHMETQDPLAYATFTFTGVAVYISSSLFPYPVSTNISLDGQTPITLNLTDPNAVNQGGGPASAISRIVGSFTDLKVQQHTLKVTVPSGGRFAIVDTFIYTSGSASTPGSPTSTATKRTRRLVVGLGIVGGLFALALFIVGCFVLKRRRRIEGRPYPYHNPSDTPDLYNERQIVPLPGLSNSDGSDFPVPSPPAIPSNSSRRPLMNTVSSRPFTHVSASTKGSGSTNRDSNASHLNRPFQPVDSLGVSRTANKDLPPPSEGWDPSSSMENIIAPEPGTAPKATHRASFDLDAEEGTMDVDSAGGQSGATWDGYEQRLNFFSIT